MELSRSTQKCLLSCFWVITPRGAWVLLSVDRLCPGFAAVWFKFISTDGTSFECSWSDKYGCYWGHITHSKFVIRSPTPVFNCPAFSESCCFWVQSSLCEPLLNDNIAFLSLPNMVIQTKNSVVLYSWVLTEGSLWVNLVLYNSRWQRCEGEDRRDKTHVNRTLPFPLATYVKCDVTSANKEWGKSFQFQGNLPSTKSIKADGLSSVGGCSLAYITCVFTRRLFHWQRAHSSFCLFWMLFIDGRIPLEGLSGATVYYEALGILRWINDTSR